MTFLILFSSPLAKNSKKFEIQFFFFFKVTCVSMPSMLVLIWNVFRCLAFAIPQLVKSPLLLEPFLQLLQSIIISSFSELHLCAVIGHLALNSVVMNLICTLTEYELLDRTCHIPLFHILQNH